MGYKAFPSQVIILNLDHDESDSNKKLLPSKISLGAYVF